MTCVELSNLAKRQRFWAREVATKDESTYPPFPKNALIELCTDQRVLEIGPGQGRQFRCCQPQARRYSVADISPDVLALPIYEPCHGRHLIETYDTRLGERFDVIHAWYVIHHVVWDALGEFMAFARRHLAADGRWLFNYSPWHLGQPNGCGTTPYKAAEIKAALAAASFVTMSTREEHKHSVEVMARAA